MTLPTLTPIIDTETDAEAGVFLDGLGADVDSLISVDNQIQWAGMLMGPGTAYGYKQLTGWDDMPGLKGGNYPLPLAPGSFIGQQYSGDRIITFTTQLHVDTLTQFKKVRQALLARTQVEQQEQTLAIRQHGQTLYVNARCTGRVVVVDKLFMQGAPQYTIQWTCSDPRRYHTTQQFQVLEAPSVSGGLDWDAGLDWGAGLAWGTETDGTEAVHSSGTSATLPTLTFEGPLTAPYSLSGEGWKLEMSTSLGDGEILIASPRAGTLELDSTDRLYDTTVSSDLLDDVSLQPGNNVLQLRTASAGDTGTVTIDWQDANG